MAEPMQLSLPLALKLQRPHRSNLSGAAPDPGSYSYATINDYNFTSQHTALSSSITRLASLLSTLFHHSDWPQLHKFFTKRYNPDSLFSRCPKLSDAAGKKHRMPVNLDLASVDLPSDFVDELGRITVEATAGMIGADPLPLAIGPALGLGLGLGIMDLCYGTTKHGWKEWAELWAVIADWVQDLDVKRAWSHCLPEGYGTAMKRELRQGEVAGWWDKEWLLTPGIRAADAVAKAFREGMKEPERFTGWEEGWWEFVDGAELEVKGEWMDRFAGAEENLEWAWREVYEGVPAPAVRRKECPHTKKGEDWEGWLLAIQPGDVIAPRTKWEAIWATVLIMQRPWTLKVLRRGETVPAFVSQVNTVYI